MLLQAVIKEHFSKEVGLAYQYNERHVSRNYSGKLTGFD
jgi:hypothetical protein